MLRATFQSCACLVDGNDASRLGKRAMIAR
jgi:hypothetical protein